jgi:uncharacterized membrane protein YdfJ with MMPL/SSD domain
MVIAFGCLMMSTQQLLVECGFFIAFSVFLDTFLVRCVVVPGIMLALEERNWWPRKGLPPTRPSDASGDHVYAALKF